MNVTTIDHVEFYVGDAEQMAFQLCTAFGFRCYGRGGPETGLVDQRSVLLGQGGIRLLLTSGLTAAHPAARYVQRHGDGISCIGMRTDDARLAFNQAVARGAEPLSAPATWRCDDSEVVAGVVAGVGDVGHRFVERRGGVDEFLPAAIVMTAQDPDLNQELLTTVDHVAMCVAAAELESVVRRYREIFGFRQIFQERIEVGEQAMDSVVVQSPSRGVTFTIIAPDPALRPGQIDDFLRSHDGAGVQHLAFATDDIVTAVRTFGARGAQFLGTPASYYDGIEERLGVVGLPLEALRAGDILVDRDHHGEMFQIFARSMSVRRTFFLELIQRCGALTFGSNNIKALYEAKERERSDVHAAS